MFGEICELIFLLFTNIAVSVDVPILLQCYSIFLLPIYLVTNSLITLIWVNLEIKLWPALYLRVSHKRALAQRARYDPRFEAFFGHIADEEQRNVKSYQRPTFDHIKTMKIRLFSVSCKIEIVNHFSSRLD